MKLIEKCKETLGELYKFSDDLLYLGESIEDLRIEDLEQKIGFLLPDDFKYIIKKHNGVILNGTQVYGISHELKGNSLDLIYNFEHYEVENPMPEFFFPFSPDGRGNHYCFDLSKLKNSICPVVFWQWDFEYENFDDVEVCNDNFTEWIEEVMIDWTLQNYNHDGSEK